MFRCAARNSPRPPPANFVAHGGGIGPSACSGGSIIDATLDWLKNNSNLISTLTTLATLVVWTVWLQLMYSDYRRRRQPRIVIHQTQGIGPESHCLLVNLSQEVIHVQCVRAAAVGKESESSLPLGSVADSAKDLGPLELENVIRQGPLAQGQFILLGSFEEILERLVDQSPEEGRQWLSSAAMHGVHTVEIRVAAIYGESAGSVGARRRFLLNAKEEELGVRPANLYTEQLYTRRKKKIAEQWLRQCLE